MGGLQELVSATSLQRRSRFAFTLDVVLSFPKPNYENPVTRGPEIYILNSIFFALMFICVVIRTYTRLFIRKWFGWDDFYIVIATVCATGVTACVMLASRNYAWDRHIYDTRTELLEPSGKAFFASKILWSWTSTAVRASVMCLYYRLLKHIGMDQYRWVLHLNSVFIFGLFIAQQTTTIFACTPISTVWTWPPIRSFKCIDHFTALFVCAVLNTFSEAVVAVLPLPIIFMLNVTNYQRNMIISMLCGGVLVVLIGCVRTYYVWQTIATHDPSWWASPHWIASEVEMDVAIICACTPAIIPVLSRVAKGGLSAAKQADPLPSNVGTTFQRPGTRMYATDTDEQEPVVPLSTSYPTSNMPSDHPRSRRTIDIEGIKPDGYGYTVTIKTGRGTKVKRRWDIREKRWHYFPEEAVSDVEEAEEEKIAPRPRKRPAFSQRPQQHKTSGSGSDTGDSEKQGMQIQTQRTADIRESFTSPKFERVSDHRNPYEGDVGDRHEESIEVAMQVPEAAVNDWSAFNDELYRPPPLKKASAPEIGLLRRTEPDAAHPSSLVRHSSAKSRKRGASYDSQRVSVVRRHNSDSSVRPRTGSSRVASSHKGSQSYENNRMGVLPSPSTINFEHRFIAPELSTPGMSVRHPPNPPVLPPAARIRRSPSPATQPVNSSHPWVTSTFLGHKRDEPYQSGTTSPESDPEGYASPRADLEARVSAPPEIWNKTSIQSSLWAENGSDRSFARPVQKPRLGPTHPHRLETDDDSDEEMNLPLQRPSPRTSAYGLAQLVPIRSQSTTRQLPRPFR